MLPIEFLTFNFYLMAYNWQSVHKVLGTLKNAVSNIHSTHLTNPY